MVKHAWSVLCDKAIVDNLTNNLSLDVIEQITIIVGDVPTEAPGILVPTPLTLVSLWYRSDPDSPCQGRVRIRIVSPNNENVGESSMEIDLTPSGRARTLCRMNALPIPMGQAGIFKFVVELQEEDWREVANVPLEIAVTKTGQV
jgi:hypothetical protein